MVPRNSTLVGLPYIRQLNDSADRLNSFCLCVQWHWFSQRGLFFSKNCQRNKTDNCSNLKFDWNWNPTYQCPMKCHFLQFHSGEAAIPGQWSWIPAHVVPPVSPGSLDHLIAPASLPAQRKNIFNITLLTIKTQPFIDLPVFVNKFNPVRIYPWWQRLFTRGFQFQSNFSSDQRELIEESSFEHDSFFSALRASVWSKNKGEPSHGSATAVFCYGCDHQHRALSHLFWCRYSFHSSNIAVYVYFRGSPWDGIRTRSAWPWKIRSAIYALLVCEMV